MSLRTFTADNLQDALALVKRELGRDAVLLHTRVITRRVWLGLKRKELIEVTACPASMAAGLNAKRQANKPAPTRPAAQSTTQSTTQSNAARTAELLSAAHAVIEENRAARLPAHHLPVAPPVQALQAYAQHASSQQSPSQQSPQPRSPQPTPTPEKAGTSLLNLPSVSTTVLAGMSQELQQIKSMVKGLVSEVRTAAPAGMPSTQCPEELFEFYKSLIENQVAENLARDIIASVNTSLRPEQLRQPALVRAKVLERLESLIPVSGGLRPTKHSGPHVVALVGPTGVGKTTTLAKLAANLQLREHKKVGLITIDTYRIAAVDQLRRYADILGSQLKVVSSPQDLAEAVASMADLDYVLIDTAGRSPKDTLRIGELARFLEAASPDEVHLVLSATSSQQCIDLAVEKFAAARIDRILFTKLDEAAHIGVILNVARRINKQLSFVTTGQDVPNDIEPSRSRRLAELLVATTPPAPASVNFTDLPSRQNLQPSTPAAK
jgi:flagellar biosynthesis protein FlhF